MNVRDKIEKVNAILEKHGSDAVQKYDTGSFMAIGYKPQFIIDSMNEVFGVGTWKHEVMGHKLVEVKTKADKTRQVAVVELKIHLLDDSGQPIFSTGTHFGGGNVVAGNVADGLKSAVTDAIGKALSVLSVGNLAYRGTLTKTVKGEITEVPSLDATNYVSSSEVSPARFQKRGNGSAGKVEAAPTAGFTPKTVETETPTPGFGAGPSDNGSAGKSRFEAIKEAANKNTSPATGSFKTSGFNSSFKTK